MKLSEAIRLGAMLKPQGFNGYFDRGGSCAIGAALDACGHDQTEAPTFCSEELWPWTSEGGEAVCPMRCQTWQLDWGERTDCYRAVIAHLNDSHRWTREQIADWVDQVEQEHERAAKPHAEVEALTP